MNVPTSEAAAENSLQVDETEIGNLLRAEISNLAKQERARPATQIENDAERIRTSVARLTSNSIDELKGLTSELQELQGFLKSEVERVEGEIENALAGIKIIIETIAPWKSITEAVAPANNRAIRGGPAANIASASPSYGRPTA